MSFADVADAPRRALLRETAGRVLRSKAARADNAEAVAELVNLRAQVIDPLQPEHFIARAAKLKVHPADLHALADTESRGFGFEQAGHARGRAIILDEPHCFSEATANAFDVLVPEVSYPTWIEYVKGRAPPKGMAQHPYTLSQDGRWGLFAQQALLSVEGACSALSVGRFQQLIGRTPTMRRQRMEPWWKAFGFGSAEHMLRHLTISEQHQLEVFSRYLEVNNLLGPMRSGDWRTVVRGYNGSGQVEKYLASFLAHQKKRQRTYA